MQLLPAITLFLILVVQSVPVAPRSPSHPDQTDRLLAQLAIDAAGGAAYCFIPTDESWTPVALVDGGSTANYANNGRLLWQACFDPFGSLLNRDDLNSLASARRCDIGHQGLFFEPYKDELA